MSGRFFLILAAVASLCAACPTVDLGDSPPDIGSCNPDFQYYQDVIWPQYLAPSDPATSCVAQAACHDSTNGRSAFRLNTAAPLDHSANYEVAKRFLNCSSPEASPLLTKPAAGFDDHGGGDLFGDPSAQVDAFLGWFP